MLGVFEIPREVPIGLLKLPGVSSVQVQLCGMGGERSGLPFAAFAASLGGSRFQVQLVLPWTGNPCWLSGIVVWDHFGEVVAPFPGGARYTLTGDNVTVDVSFEWPGRVPLGVQLGTSIEWTPLV